MAETQPNRAELHRRAFALPLVEGEFEPIDNITANALLHDVKKSGSRLPDHLVEQANRFFHENADGLQIVDGNNVVLPVNVLRNIVNRAMRKGAAVTIYDIGEVIADSNDLYDLLDNAVPVEEPFPTMPEQPPAA
jgi:hypothetical protein